MTFARVPAVLAASHGRVTGLFRHVTAMCHSRVTPGGLRLGRNRQVQACLEGRS
jgi:hypothetical protein